MGTIVANENVWKNMREKIEYLLVKMLLFLAKVLPKSFLYVLTKMLAFSFYFLLKSRRKLTIKNLQNAFPDRSEAEIIKLSKEIYSGLSETLCEILLMFADRFDIDAAIINKDEAIEQLIRLAKSDKGVMVITAHYSNWELAAHFLAKHNLPMLAIGRRGTNALIDRNLTIPFRNRYGNRAVYKDKAMIAMAKALKAKENVGMLIDQKTGGSHNVRVDFFGHGARTTLSAAALKLKFDPIVAPISIVRQSRGKYMLYVDAPIEYRADEIADEKEKLEAITQRYNQALEKMIGRDISQWFWMHDRWK